MMARKASFGYRSRGQSNARPADHRPAATLSPKTRPVAAAEKSFVEFHPSMSLENAPTVTDCLSDALPTATMCRNMQSLPDADDSSLEAVLADRHQVWTKVCEIIEKLTPLEAYRGDVHALRKLQQLHLLCKQRETHLRTLQITLMDEGRTLPQAKSEMIASALDETYVALIETCWKV